MKTNRNGNNKGRTETGIMKTGSKGRKVNSGIEDNTGAEVNAGSGRAKSRRQGKIRIRTELCKGCKYCVISCPKGVIELNKELNTSGFYTAYALRMEDCSGCAICAKMCPEVAIEVWAD